SGVSITRSAPKRCCSPTVARKTPPLTPTSSPSTTTLASSSMARANARLIASTSVSSGISTELRSLARVTSRQLGVEMIEHRLRRARRGRQIAFDRRLDLLLALGRELFLLRFAPRFLADEIGAQPRDRLLLPARLNLLGGPVARRVICGRMVAQPIGQRLDQPRPATPASLRDRLLPRG